MSKVHTTLRILRERAGITQTHLAHLLDRGQAEVSMWEWGQEKMSEPVRNQITGILKAYLGSDGPLLRSGDLDRPWDEVALEWKERSASDAR